MINTKKTLEQVVKLPEAESYERAIHSFQKKYNELYSQVKKGMDTSNKGPIFELTKQLDELQKQKEEATSKVHFRLEKKQPCDDLFSEIAKISEEVRTREILIKSYTRKEQYPRNEIVAQMSLEAFSAGVNTISAGKEFGEAFECMNSDLQEAINYLQSQKNKIAALTLQRMVYEDNIVRSFGYMNPEEAARCTWDELRTMAFGRIKKELYGKGGK